MSDPGARLQEIRSERFSSRRAAALALGIPPTTYNQYETGEREFSRHAGRFSRFFRVNLEWLLTGKGDKRPKVANVMLPIMGLVGAGASVELVVDAAGCEPPGEIALPHIEKAAALIVRGDSQWPRFLEGEIIIYEKEPSSPESLLGQYAVIQDLNGRVMIKILRRGTKTGTFRLESHNAPPEDNVTLLGAWRYLGTLAR